MKSIVRSAFLFAVVLSGSVHGSAGKSVIAIVPFTASLKDEISTLAARNATEAVADMITKSNRAMVADRTKMAQLSHEREFQKTENFLSSRELVEQSKLLGAQYVLAGNVDSADATPNKDNHGHVTSYAATVVLSLKVLDLESGVVTASERFEVSSGAGSGVFGAMLSFAKSPQDAIRSALGDLSKKINPFIAKNFTLFFSLAEVSEKQGDAASKVLLAGGSSAGLKKGDVFKVFEISMMEVDGKKLARKKDVGELVVDAVEDENFSSCTVARGGQAIAEKVASKTKLQAVPFSPSPLKK